MEYASASSNIFQAPVATGAPSTMFEVKEDHPVPRTGIIDSGPHQTNKFYANFFLGNQNAPTFLHPYSVAWAKGQGPTSSWGLAVSHIEAHQRVYGQAAPETGAAKYFLNPIGIQSLCLSAAELESSTALTLDKMEAQSVNVNLLDKAEGKTMLTFPLVQGMAYVTGIYHGSTPTFSTGIFFRTVTRSTMGAKPGVTKYTIYLEDGKIWHLYAYSPRGDSLDLQVINNAHAKALRPYHGIVQVAKDPGGAETLIDASSGAYPTGVKLSGSVSGNQGTYTFKYEKGGCPDTQLMMYALPHHVESFDGRTHQRTTQVRLQTTTKGMATAVVADSWTMVEPNMPVSMGFAPWDPVTGSKRTLKPEVIDTIGRVALKEISQNVDQQSNQNSMYFSGKVSLGQPLLDFGSLTTCRLLENLRIFVLQFMICCGTPSWLTVDSPTSRRRSADLPQISSSFPYTTRVCRCCTSSRCESQKLTTPGVWGGIVSSATYETGDNGADFGNTFYNDHHFHYGYFILTAAIIGHLDPGWLTHANVDWVNTLVRDIANPSICDKYFPVFRNFDWYHGHSWAHGLYETLDGKVGVVTLCWEASYWLLTVVTGPRIKFGRRDACLCHQDVG